MGYFELHSVSKSFNGNRLIETEGFVLKTGDIIGLFGRNGSGKSTLLKMIFGTMRADHIRISFNGMSVRPSEIIPKQLIAYVPQKSMLPKNTRVRDIIPIYYPEGEKQDPIFYDKVIAGFTNRKVNELSHGERKYFEVILGCFLPHPFIMLDEPFSMLEPLQAQSLKLFLKETSKSKGILLTDHYYNDVLQVTTKQMVLKDGALSPIESLEDLRRFKYLSGKV